MNGVLAEQLIGQQLRCFAPAYQDGELYYWAREQRAAAAEVDYVLADERGRIIPTEVKAGRTGRLRSLQVMASEKKLELAVRFNSAPPSMLDEQRTTAVGEARFRLLSLPHYLCPALPRLLASL